MMQHIQRKRQELEDEIKNCNKKIEKAISYIKIRRKSKRKEFKQMRKNINT